MAQMKVYTGIVEAGNVCPAMVRSDELERRAAITPYHLMDFLPEKGVDLRFGDTIQFTVEMGANGVLQVDEIISYNGRYLVDLTAAPTQQPPYDPPEIIIP